MVTMLIVKKGDEMNLELNGFDSNELGWIYKTMYLYDVKIPEYGDGGRYIASTDEPAKFSMKHEDRVVKVLNWWTEGRDLSLEDYDFGQYLLNGLREMYSALHNEKMDNRDEVQLWVDESYTSKHYTEASYGSPIEDKPNVGLSIAMPFHVIFEINKKKHALRVSERDSEDIVLGDYE